MKRIIQMSIIATSGMTLFSYILSHACNEKFLETKLLNQLIFPDKKETHKYHPAGVAIQYAVGTFFSVFYYKLWKRSTLRPNDSTSSVMGFFNGLTGIIGWHSILTLHSNPPEVNIRKYYLQLLFAHVIFGFLNGLVFRWMLKNKE